MRTRSTKRNAISTIAAVQTKLWLMAVALAGFSAGPTSALAQCVPPDCDDGLFCTVDICSVGNCFNNVRSCQDGLFCNGIEVCDDTRDLCAVACLDGGTCTGGLCVGGSNPGAACDPTATPVNCPVGTSCSENLDACVECLSSSDCANPTQPFCNPSDGTCVACYLNGQCSNGLFCDGSETCNLGTNQCEDGNAVQCPINPPTFCSEIFGGACVECETSADCSGGSFCDPKECSAGACVDSTPTACKRCVDINNNQSGPCDDNGDCDAGFTCTGASSFCSDVVGRCVMCLEDANCEDLNFCTRNECSKLDFTCQYPPDGATICADLNGFLFCEGPELCVNQIGVCDPFTGANCCQPGTPPATDDGIPCTADSCDEVNDVIVHQPDDFLCDDTLFCTGAETCDPGNGASNANGCVTSPDIDCSSLDAECRISSCNEATDSCDSHPDLGANGTNCVDPSNCEDVDLCDAGACVAFPPEPDDPYRCVVLELQPRVPGPFEVGEIVAVDLIARADGCNTVSARCALDEHPIVAITAVLDWEPDKLKLREAALGSPNPIDGCDNLDPCFQCPVDTYNWGNSAFPFDCGTTGFNEPCGATGPANDGDAFYIATDQLSADLCNDGLPPAPPCVSVSGLLVTTFEFEVLPGAFGTTSLVAFADCAMEIPGASSKVLSKLQAPVPLTGNVTEELVDAVINVAACLQTSDCDDGDPCTLEICHPSGTCANPPLCNTHPDPCVIRTCNPTTVTCEDVPVSCDVGEVCFDGDCFVGCDTVADCNDGVSCTIDTCEPQSGGNPVDVCVHTVDDALCDTGLFCSQQRCDLDLGCILSHECISTTGNPCPDPATCDDVADNCGGCLPPVVAGVGPRYLSITPQDQGATPLALLVEGACGDPDVACVSSYVQSICVGGSNVGQSCQTDANCPKLCQLGENHLQPCTFDIDCSAGGGSCVGACSGLTLGPIPSYHPASFWGEARVGGIEIHPGTDYTVRTLCDFGSGPVGSVSDAGTTYKWGDANGDSFVNVTDIVAVVDVVKQVANLSVPFEGGNMWPCDLDTRANVSDITVTVDAVKGVTYPCALTCP